MKKNMGIALILLLLFTVAKAQTDKLDKKLDKATALMHDGKYDDADKYLEKLVTKNPGFGKGWDLLVKLQYDMYLDSKNKGDTKLILVETNGKDTIKNDTLANKLQSMLNAISPSKKAFSKFLYTAREATLMTNDCYISSFYLRNFLVDIDIDSNVNKKALKYFNDAETSFGDNSYQKAVTEYKQALDEQPNFYKASLYLGDVYYQMGEYAEATTIFKNNIEKYPFLLEPRKYLIDSYAKQNMYSKALTVAIDAMTVYPDYSDEEKMNDISHILNKKIAIIWTPRPIFPNRIGMDSLVPDLNTYVPDHELEAKKPWTYYANAFDKIKSYCNGKGIIVKPTTLTQSKYMEVYSWEEMLANSNAPELDEARKMQEAGYLDCYVLITCFHQDFYGQYLDFVSKNKDKVIQYYKLFIN